MLTRICKVVLLLALVVSVAPVAAQKSDVAQKINTAVQQMDDGLYDESEALLREAIALEPENFKAWYELAFLYSLKKDHAEALKTALKAAKMPGASDLAYQIAGTSADYMGDPAKAVSLYKQGLKKFPNSGRLHLELGNMTYNSGQKLEALDYFERGIAAQPNYPSNYRNAVLVLQNSSEPIWALLYAEIFMNVERSGKRMMEMGRWLYNAYKNAISIETKEGKRVVKLDFTQNKTITMDPKGTQLRIPFPIVFSLTVESAFPEQADAVDLESLNRMRLNFIQEFFDEQGANYGARYSNILFDYQRRIAEAGHLEAYNYWILGDGDQEARNTWVEAHPGQWDAFIEWFRGNPLSVDAEHHFVRSQYNNVVMNLK